ncbi:MAG: hypothetical protein Q8P68_04475 [Candidatus Peregrinibacteria bacterium]|nr:hypothetical protein [Candidatus Peregrinibacteria bacterium]MDZ4244857.1 hypothetical protein [Candidatus Gracilibacteria bacterium]
MLITFIINPIKKLHPKDGSMELARVACERGHEVILIEEGDIRYETEEILSEFYNFPNLKKENSLFDLSKSDVIMMRLDPPFNLNYVYHTYILDKLKKLNSKIKIINPPGMLRSWNEKMAILNFPKLIPPTMVAKKTDEILSFSHKYAHGIILKPLNEKGGSGITWLKPDDTHQEKLKKIATITKREKEFIMVQEYLKEACEGDKRITVVNGKIINCILRVPKKDDFRGNISQGATGHPSTVTEKELKAVKIIIKELKKQKIFFAGLDFIGERLTELNITSPIVGFTIFKGSGEKIIKELEKI